DDPEEPAGLPARADQAMKPYGWLAALALLAGAAPALSQPVAIALAIQAGQVGERYDGYMGFVVPPSPEVRRQIAAVNLRRRNPVHKGSAPWRSLLSAMFLVPIWPLEFSHGRRTGETHG